MDSFIAPSAGTPANPGIAADLIKESSTASFEKDVLQASVTTPVLVDFWAPWCGPCRQLGPAIEKIVTEFAGKVKLVKINVDENQALAGQMGVQSIPAVFAFAGGRPVDGFMGALPESEIRAFVQKTVDAMGGAAPADDMEAQITEALEAAAQALEAGDYASAEHVYGLVLQHKPDHDGALTGLALTCLKTGDLDRAEATLDLVSEEGQKAPDYLSAISSLQLKREAADLGSIAELEQRLAKDENDHQARFDLALALNADGFKLEAAEALVKLMRQNRDWNEDAARKKLLELFDAWGPKDPATLKGRRLLSTALFA